MAGFVLADILKGADVPKMGTGLQQIPIGRLHPDPNNFYTVDPDSVRELAGNIATIGLQQPLNVRPEGEDYTVISGHRRLAALRLLVDEDERQDLAVVPCMVVDSGSEALNELRLIYGNANTRRLTDWELAKTAERVEALFYQLKEEGFDFPGRMRDHVAAACQASKSKLARLKVIREKLKPKVFREAFAQGSLSESAAYEIARREEAVQEKAAELATFCKIRTAEEVAQMLDTIEQHFAQDKQTVESVAEGLDQLSSAPGYDSTQAYLEARAEQDAKYFAVMQHFARSFAGRLSVLWMSRGENIQQLKAMLKAGGGGTSDYSWWGASVGLTLNDGVGRENSVTRTWTEAYDALAAACILIVAEMEDKDEDEGIRPQWQTGDPERPGEYWVELDFNDGAPPIVDNVRWDGQKWRCFVNEDVTILGWWPLPEV